MLTIPYLATKKGLLKTKGLLVCDRNIKVLMAMSALYCFDIFFVDLVLDDVPIYFYSLFAYVKQSRYHLIQIGRAHV